MTQCQADRALANAGKDLPHLPNRMHSKERLLAVIDEALSIVEEDDSFFGDDDSRAE